MEAILAPLNDPQRRAVAWEGRHLLVVAGAGSGKTRVLTHRIAYLLRARGVPPEAILALTFTNKAAGEMSGRVAALIAGARMPVMGTFHAVCARFLREHAPLIGYPRDFTILDRDDQLTLIRKILADRARGADLFPPDRILGFIDRWKNEGASPGDLGDGLGFLEEEAATVYAAYEQALRDAGALDFGNLLLLMNGILAGNEAVRERYRARFRHILVDEYQDTNRVQSRLLALLAGEGTSVFAVGDEDQCIYGWRGACLDNILSFRKTFPGAGLVVLEENYRSTATILKAATSLVRHNRLREEKSLFTTGPAGEKVEVWTFESEYREADAVARHVADLARRGGDVATVAVLYRINAQGRALEEALRTRGIRYRIYGGLPFYRRAEIKDLTAYLRAAASPGDEVALRRSASVPPRGLGEAFWGWLQSARAPGERIGEALRRLHAAGEMPGRYAAAVERFVGVLDGIARRKGDPGVIDHAARASGLLDHYAARGGDDAEARRENIAELARGLRHYLAEHPGASLGEWIADIALSSEEEGDDVAGGVHLMTLHAAKGLEFPRVFVLGLEEGLVPHGRSEGSAHALEEERRLLYVGMTRAQEKLVLSWSRNRGLRSRLNPGRPSPFLADIDRDALSFTLFPEGDAASPQRERGGAAAPPAAASDPGRVATLSLSGRPVTVGSRVRHRDFGEGVVTSLAGEGDRARVEVLFRSVGRKKLALSLAPLTVVS